MAASAAGLVGPQLLERIINASGALTDATIDSTALLFTAALVVQTIFTAGARACGALTGEYVLARLRERFHQHRARTADRHRGARRNRRPS